MTKKNERFKQTFSYPKNHFIQKHYNLYTKQLYIS